MKNTDKSGESASSMNNGENHVVMKTQLRNHLVQLFNILWFNPME